MPDLDDFIEVACNAILTWKEIALVTSIMNETERTFLYSGLHQTGAVHKRKS